jgi:hypothetical protein
MYVYTSIGISHSEPSYGHCQRFMNKFTYIYIKRNIKLNASIYLQVSRIVNLPMDTASAWKILEQLHLDIILFPGKSNILISILDV